MLCLGNTSQTLRRSAHVDGPPMKAAYAALLGGIRAAACLGVSELEVWGSSRALVRALVRARGSAEHGLPWPLDAACARAAGRMQCSYVSVYPENNLATRS